MKFFAAAALLISAAASASAGSAQVPGLTTIGTAAAVRGKVAAAAPAPLGVAPVGRIVTSGMPMYLNDHVKTGKEGHLQVLLADETVFTLGPDSDMVLDEFVYDPNTNAGKITANISRGTFRFVTGKLAHQDPAGMKIKLAVGTIGIRGSVGAGQTGPEGSIVINAGAGDANDNSDNTSGIYAANESGTTNLRRPGSGTEIKPGQKPSAAADYSTRLDNIMHILSAPAGHAQTTTAPAGNVDRISGRETAKGVDLSVVATNVTTVAQTLNTVAVQAVQDSVFSAPDGPTTWDFVRSNVTIGSGLYYGSGAISCAGAGCSSGPTGMNLTLQYDFGAHTYGGPSISCLHLTNSIGAVTDQYMIYQVTSFPASGAAVITLNGSQGSGGGTGTFTGTTITLANKGGVVAKQAVVNLNYVNSSASITSATGNITATR